LRTIFQTTGNSQGLPFSHDQMRLAKVLVGFLSQIASFVFSVHSWCMLSYCTYLFAHIHSTVLFPFKFLPDFFAQAERILVFFFPISLRIPISLYFSY